MILAWGAKVSPEFRERVVRICARLGFDPSWLMACMAFETGRTFDPAKRNSASSATGLIQFMSSTAVGLNTTTEALAAMSAVEQLDYVARYFQPYAGRIKSLPDCYMAILWPAAVGKADDALIFYPGSQAYLANKGLDIDHDGAVTKREAAAFVVKALAEGMQPGNAFDLTVETSPPPLTQRKGENTMDPLSLISILTSVFAPLIRAKVDKAVGSDVGQPLVDNLLGMASKLTGKADPMEAIAVARQDPAIVQQLQATAEDWFAQMAPALDKIAALESASWAAEDAGRDAAGVRGRADSVDIAPTLVLFAGALVGGVLLFLMIIMGIQTWFNDEHAPGIEMLTLVGPLLGTVFGVLATVYAYRFGSSRQSGAKDLVISEMVKRGKV